MFTASKNNFVVVTAKKWIFLQIVDEKFKYLTPFLTLSVCSQVNNNLSFLYSGLPKLLQITAPQITKAKFFICVYGMVKLLVVEGLLMQAKLPNKIRSWIWRAPYNSRASDKMWTNYELKGQKYLSYFVYMHYSVKRAETIHAIVG